jgi:hypothetical protein
VSLPSSDAQSSGFLPQHPQHPQHPQNPQQRPQHVQAVPHSMAVPVAASPGSPAYPANFTNPAPVNTPRLPSSPLPGKPFPAPSPSPSSSMPMAERADQIARERAIDFASQSWDLATGGLKTLTAKRQLPPLPDRRLSEKLSEPADADISRSYTFMLVVLACLVLMLFSAGVVLWIMVQP